MKKLATPLHWLIYIHTHVAIKEKPPLSPTFFFKKVFVVFFQGQYTWEMSCFIYWIISFSVVGR